MTVQDTGEVGIGTTSPRAQLHVVSTGCGAGLAVSGQLVMRTTQSYPASAATPNSTVVAGIGAGANLAREGIYFFWKNSAGDRFGAILQPDSGITDTVRQSGSS